MGTVLANLVRVADALLVHENCDGWYSVHDVTPPTVLTISVDASTATIITAFARKVCSSLNMVAPWLGNIITSVGEFSTSVTKDNVSVDISDFGLTTGATKVNSTEVGALVGERKPSAAINLLAGVISTAFGRKVASLRDKVAPWLGNVGTSIGEVSALVTKTPNVSTSLGTFFAGHMTTAVLQS